MSYFSYTGIPTTADGRSFDRVCTVMRKFWIMSIAILLYGFVGMADGSDIPNGSWVHKTIFGLLLHDRGPFSDRHEKGVDLNGELQFKPPEWPAWRWIGSPNPMLGFTPNFNGDTSAFYGGLNYEWSLSNRWVDDVTGNLTRDLFIGVSLSVALHNGPSHKNVVGCEERSDCGFGYRALPRLGFEVGSYIAGKHAVSIFYDHMSHKGILPGENEGVDHIGIRYHLRFGQRF
jgi:lipid A 3-O-deacylase